MTVLLTLVGISLAVWILWLADRWGLGEGGELLFKVCIGVGAIWLAYDLGVLGVLIFLAATALYLKYRSYRARQRAKEELRGKLEAES
jgi:hypothetical protein